MKSYADSHPICDCRYRTPEEAALIAKESAQHIPQQPQERHCSHQFVYREYIGQTPGKCVFCGAFVE